VFLNPIRCYIYINSDINNNTARVTRTLINNGAYASVSKNPFIFIVWVFFIDETYNGRRGRDPMVGEKKTFANAIPACSLYNFMQ
jgi:hypothetical protein